MLLFAMKKLYLGSYEDVFYILSIFYPRGRVSSSSRFVSVRSFKATSRKAEMLCTDQSAFIGKQNAITDTAAFEEFSWQQPTCTYSFHGKNIHSA